MTKNMRISRLHDGIKNLIRFMFESEFSQNKYLPISHIKFSLCLTNSMESYPSLGFKQKETQFNCNLIFLEEPTIRKAHI